MATHRAHHELAEPSVFFSGDATKQTDRKAFQLLPLELNRRIGLFVEDDFDITNYAATCAATADSIYGNERHYWRLRFQTKFDEPSKRYKKDVYTHNGIYQMVYCRYRYKAFEGKVTHFKYGFSEQERRTLAEMVQVMNEAHSVTSKAMTGEGYSRNVNFILKYVSQDTVEKSFKPQRPGAETRSGLLDMVLRHSSDTVGPSSNTLYAVQLCFADIMLGLEHANVNAAALTPIHNWIDSKLVVYRERSPRVKRMGLYSDGKVDFLDLLHIVNYFKCFFTGQEYMFTKECYAESSLGREGMPHSWSLPFSNKGSSLGSAWRGTYGFVDFARLSSLRTVGELVAATIDDQNVDGAESDPFQSLKITPCNNSATLVMLSVFDKFLHNGIDYPQTPISSEANIFTFGMDGVDGADDFVGVGCITPLPAQENIRGFQRMTMMKYYTDAIGGFDKSSLWAYEGVVLPGANIMLGRWFRAIWDADTVPTQMGEDSGPFIFWNVPDNAGKTRGMTPNEDDYAASNFEAYKVEQGQNGHADQLSKIEREDALLRSDPALLAAAIAAQRHPVPDDFDNMSPGLETAEIAATMASSMLPTPSFYFPFTPIMTEETMTSSSTTTTTTTTASTSTTDSSTATVQPMALDPATYNMVEESVWTEFPSFTLTSPNYYGGAQSRSPVYSPTTPAYGSEQHPILIVDSPAPSRKRKCNDWCHGGGGGGGDEEGFDADGNRIKRTVLDMDQLDNSTYDSIECVLQRAPSARRRRRASPLDMLVAALKAE